METAINFKKASTKNLVDKLSKNLVKGTEKENILGILKNRKVDVTKFESKTRGRARVQKEEHASIPVGVRVKFAKYRDEKTKLTGEVINNSNSWVAKDGQKHYLLTIKVEDKKTKTVQYLSKKADKVQVLETV